MSAKGSENQQLATQMFKKDEYDVEACEADMNTAQEYRLDMYEDHLVGAKAKETEIYETAKVAIKASFE